MLYSLAQFRREISHEKRVGFKEAEKFFGARLAIAKDGK